jgi:hypothetical protein
MKTDEALDPIDVGFFGARTIAVHAHGLPDPVEQFRRFGGGRNGGCHVAAFLTTLPRRGQEIDCKLQSNSR